MDENLAGDNTPSQSRHKSNSSKKAYHTPQFSRIGFITPSVV